jgi:hypothetical protein
MTLLENVGMNLTSRSHPVTDIAGNGVARRGVRHPVSVHSYALPWGCLAGDCDMATDNYPADNGNETTDGKNHNLWTVLVWVGMVTELRTRLGWETASRKLPAPESLRFVTI